MIQHRGQIIAGAQKHWVKHLAVAAVRDGKLDQAGFCIFQPLVL